MSLSSSAVNGDTEVWDLINADHKVINPSLPKNSYYYGIGLYLVDLEYCKKGK